MGKETAKRLKHELYLLEEQVKRIADKYSVVVSIEQDNYTHYIENGSKIITTVVRAKAQTYTETYEAEQDYYATEPNTEKG